jgi:serine/threonine protein kinase
VYIVTNKETGEKFALKQVVPKNEKEERNILNEISLMQLSQHSNIISYYESYRFKNAIFVVMELMHLSLTQLIQTEYGRIPETLMAFICHEILQGLTALHNEHRIHRDIKSDNILIDMSGNVKLGDFGYAAQLTDERETR